VLRVPLSRDHLSVISGITAQGWLHARVQNQPFRGVDAARFLQQLTTHISVRLLVIWDGSPIHRCQAIKAFLASPAGQGVHLEQLPPYAPELNPDEGVWNYLKRVEECYLSAFGPAILRVRQGHQAAQAEAPHHSCLHRSGWAGLTLYSMLSN
jgi:DDE superfamily endonuclease